jgi:hypothetical protein
VTAASTFSDADLTVQLRLVGAADVLGRRYHPAPAPQPSVRPDAAPYEGETARLLGAAGA